MIYEIDFSKQAAKELEKINEPYYSSITEAILNLSQNPRPIGYLKLTNKQGYRIRVGNYRIIYDIFDSQLVIDIITIGHRKNVYD